MSKHLTSSVGTHIVHEEPTTEAKKFKGKTVLEQITDLDAGMSTSEDKSPTDIFAHAAEITKKFDTDIMGFQESFVDWFAIANTMPDQKHGTVAIAKTKYRLNQVLQALWQGVNGNRTKEEVVRGERLERDSVRYSDGENAKYRASLVSSLDLPADGAQEQLSFEEAGAINRATEGELRLEAWNKLFSAFLSVYELVCEDTWVYTPWQEADKRKANTASVMHEIMGRRAQRRAAAE